VNAVDDPRAALLQAMLAGGEGAPTMEDLASQMAESDPTVAMLLQYMAKQNAETEAQDAEDVDDPDPSIIEASYHYLDDDRARQTAEAFQELRQRVEALYVELQDLRGRNRDFAAALGACARCWGQDANCPMCAGEGAPGGAPLDVYLYRRLIAPATRRLNSGDPAEGFGSRAVPRASESGRPRRIGVETR
jgi:hypothetical protein